MIQAVVVNFDANVSSQNGLKSTHALALLLTQNKKTVDNKPEFQVTIDRVSKDAMKTPVTSHVEVKHYQGHKKPDMLATYAQRCVLTL